MFRKSARYGDENFFENFWVERLFLLKITIFVIFEALSHSIKMG